MKLLNYFYCYCLLIISLPACEPVSKDYKIETQKSPAESLFIGLHAINDTTVWASGTGSTIIKTTDGGKSWHAYQYPVVDSLQFRDIYGLGREEAIVLSAGQGSQSGIFRFSEDKGWHQTFQMNDTLGFLDGLDFWNEDLGLAYGDATDTLPYLLSTGDGGKTWKRVRQELPRAGKGEGGFAASGTLIELAENGRAWIGTGAGGNARVLHTSNFGQSWQAIATPMVKGEAAGITTVRHCLGTLLIAGGDIAIADGQKDHLFISEDNGITWNKLQPPPLKSAIYGSAFTQIDPLETMLVTGPDGAALSFDKGNTWSKISDLDLWTCELLPSGTGWIMGKDGRILKISIQ